jgi:hypothetical protein
MLDPDERFASWTLARFELFMESTRREELRPMMRYRIDELSRCSTDAAGLVDRLLCAFLD